MKHVHLPTLTYMGMRVNLVGCWLLSYSHLKNALLYLSRDHLQWMTEKCRQLLGVHCCWAGRNFYHTIWHTGHLFLHSFPTVIVTPFNVSRMFNIELFTGEYPTSIFKFVCSSFRLVPVDWTTLGAFHDKA